MVGLSTLSKVDKQDLHRPLLKVSSSVIDASRNDKEVPLNLCDPGEGVNIFDFGYDAGLWGRGIHRVYVAIAKCGKNKISVGAQGDVFDPDVGEFNELPCVDIGSLGSRGKSGGIEKAKHPGPKCDMHDCLVKVKILRVWKNGLKASDIGGHTWHRCAVASI
jgi:hypothetical protein